MHFTGTTLKAKLFNFIIRFTSLFSLSANRRMARAMAKLIWVLAKKNRRTTQINIDKCFPEISEHERVQLAKDSIANTLMNFFELGPLWVRLARVDDVIDNIYGLEEFEASMAQGKGALLAAPHHGNWEVMNLFLARFDGFAFLYKPPSDPRIEQSLIKFRGKSKALQIEASMKGVRKIMTHFKSNGFVAILPDQKPKSGQGVYAPFFTHPTYTMTLFSRLAAKTKVPVFFIYAVRTDKGFNVHFEKSPRGIYGSMQESVECLNQSIEKIVRNNPEQYQWTYRRFSIQPEGAEDFYR